MHKSITVGLFALAVSGCAASVQSPTNTPNQVQAQAPEEKVAKPDAFDKTGFIIAVGSRWMWNETNQVWQWIDSDANKARLHKAVDLVKSAASHTWDFGKEELTKK